MGALPPSPQAATPPRYLSPDEGAGLDHIAYGDDADELAILDHGHVAEATVGHARKYRIRAVLTRTADRIAGHHLVDRLGQATAAAHRQRAHDVAFRQDPFGMFAIARHDKPADPALRKDLCRFGDLRPRFDRQYAVIALGLEDLLNEHGRSSA